MDGMTDRIGGIAANDERFLFRSALRLFLGLLGHHVLLSQRFLSAVKVPQPGIEPGRPCGSRECKSRLSANSSTGAYRVKLEAVVGEVLTGLPTTAWFLRPSSAALPLSSCRASSTRRRTRRRVLTDSSRHDWHVPRRKPQASAELSE